MPLAVFPTASRDIDFQNPLASNSIWQNLVGFWGVTGNGLSALDISPNRNNATATNAMSGTGYTNGQAWGWGVQGGFAQSLKYNGNGNYTNVPSSPSVNAFQTGAGVTKASTFTCWVKLNSLSATLGAVLLSSNSSMYWQLGKTSNATVFLGSTTVTTSYLIPWTDGNWHHIAILCIPGMASATAVVYHNGVNVGSQFGTPGMLTGPKTFVIGDYAGTGNTALNTGYQVNGFLAGVGLWQRALAPGELTLLYREGLTNYPTLLNHRRKFYMTGSYPSGSANLTCQTTVTATASLALPQPVGNACVPYRPQTGPQIDLQNPVNQNHPYASGLLNWYRILPERDKTHNRYWPDIGVAKNHAGGQYFGVRLINTNNAPPPGSFGAGGADILGLITPTTLPGGFTGGHTVSFWLWCVEGGSGVIVGGAFLSTDAAITVGVTAGTCTLSYTDDVGNSATVTFPQVSQQWVHITVIRFFGWFIYVYQNGLLVGRQELANALHSFTYDAICYNNTTSMVDDVRVYTFPIEIPLSGFSGGTVWQYYQNAVEGCPGLLNRRQAFVPLTLPVTSIGTANGTSSASGVGAVQGSATGTASATSSASGVGAELATSTGTANGTSSASGVGLAPEFTTGTANGTSSASGVGAIAYGSTGTASATSSASGVGYGGSVGTASATSSASGVGYGSDVVIPVGGFVLGSPLFANGYRYRHTLTLRATTQSITGFVRPVVDTLLPVTKTTFAITDINGKSLPFERIKYNNATGFLSVFVKINTIANVPTTIYIFYG